MLFKKQNSGSSSLDYTTTDLQTPSYWIIASRGNNQIRVSTALIESSTDGGTTWSNSIAFTDANLIMHGFLYENGNCSIFTTDNKIYLTTTALSSVDEKTLYESDRTTAYVFHTPSNSSYPGAYFEIEDHQTSTDETKVHCIANYCNSAAIDGGRGASSIIVPMTDDYGESWIVSYEFGQNLRWRDDGTATGGSTGALLGDSGNSEVTRHVHSIEYNPYNGKFYMNTGDQYWTFSTPDMDEVNWYEGTYSTSTRTISWSQINFGTIIYKTDNLKATGIYFTPTHIYWGSDANPVTVPDNQGIFRSPIATFDTPSTHETVYQLDTDDVIICMKFDYNTNTVLAILLDENDNTIKRLLAIKDFGHGEADIYTVTGSPTLLRLNTPNSDGYWRCDFDGFNQLQTKSLLIKVGEDLFTNL